MVTPRAWTFHLLQSLLLKRPDSVVSIEEEELQACTVYPSQLLVSRVCRADRQQCQPLPSSFGGGGLELTFSQNRELLRDKESQPERDPGEVSASQAGRDSLAFYIGFQCNLSQKKKLKGEEQ